MNNGPRGVPGMLGAAVKRLISWPWWTPAKSAQAAVPPSCAPMPMRFPCWGIGLTQAVNDHTRFLHDGCARNLLEAILWHGGEAQPAREKVRAMPRESREALLDFLQSL